MVCLQPTSDITIRLITNRAFDMEKRQHLFANRIIQPLKPDQVGFYGMGLVNDLGIDIQGAEDEIDRRFSQKGGVEDVSPILEVKGQGIGPGEAGREKEL